MRPFASIMPCRQAYRSRNRSFSPRLFDEVILSAGVAVTGVDVTGLQFNITDCAKQCKMVRYGSLLIYLFALPGLLHANCFSGFS